MPKPATHIRRLQKLNKTLQEHIDELERDRTLYRTWFAEKFKWFIELNASKERPALPWLIKDMAQLLTKAKPWTWNW